MWGMALHCALYTLGIYLFTFWTTKLILIFVTHFIIDYFGIGKNIYPDIIKMGKPYSKAKAPDWLRMLTDQCIHIVILAIIVNM